MLDLIFHPSFDDAIHDPELECRMCRKHWPVDKDEPFLPQLRLVVLHSCGHLHLVNYEARAGIEPA